MILSLYTKTTFFLNLVINKSEQQQHSMASSSSSAGPVVYDFTLDDDDEEQKAVQPAPQQKDHVAKKMIFTFPDGLLLPAEQFPDLATFSTVVLE